MDKLRFKILILLVVACLAVAGFVAFKNKGQGQPKDLPEILAAPIDAPTPSTDQVTTVVASDGLKTLEMKQNVSNGQTTYILNVSDDKGTKNTVFSKTYDPGWVVSIPYNTFSPDDKYLFLKINGPNSVSYIVVSATGAPVSANNQTLEIAGLFGAKEPNYKLADVTGWAAPTLIIINSVNSSTNGGQSFWFDLSSQSFIPLSNYFH